MREDRNDFQNRMMEATKTVMYREIQSLRLAFTLEEFEEKGARMQIIQDVVTLRGLDNIPD